MVAWQPEGKKHMKTTGQRIVYKVTRFIVTMSDINILSYQFVY